MRPVARGGRTTPLSSPRTGCRGNSRCSSTDLRTAIRVYAHGSVVESKLASWLQDGYDEAGYLDGIEGPVPRGETEDEMEKLEGLAMRNQFGGHKVVKR